MIEVLQFLFATAKDQNLYSNPTALIRELLNEQQFTPSEVEQAMEWFAPVLSETVGLDISPLAVRSISSWEKDSLPTAILSQILKWERNKTINMTEREILLDRLSELGLDWQVEDEEMQDILDGLIYHLQNYKQALFADKSTATPYFWCNHTLH